MKVFIIYASAGAGHRRVAEAVYNYLKERRPELEIRIIDILDKANSVLRFDYTKGYAFLIRHAVWLWSFAFWLTETKALRPLSRLVSSLADRVSARQFSNFLVRENPDYVISTHFLPSGIAVYLKNKGRISSFVMTIITDFGVHPFWIWEGTDLYMAASEFTKGKLLKEGVSEKKIKVSGLPADMKFLKKFDRVSLAAKIGIAADKFTVLLMTGSFGTGPLEEISGLLCRDLQVLVVCASNKKLYERMNEINLPNTKVFGFVDNPEELMAVSDVILTKPGGSTIAEIIDMELVPVFISAIPGQEEGNVEALAKAGIGLAPRGIYEIRDLILDFKDHPEKLKKAKEAVRQIKKPYACQEISGVIR
ncbi:MAG: glycosyltransferase [Candidatus Omnitrophota bacterium]